MAEEETKAEAKEEPKAQSSAPAGDRKVNWVLALILSIIFGQLGVDRFMMGQTGLGIVKLLTAGGCGIWWIIDVILIATKHKFDGVEWVEN